MSGAHKLVVAAAVVALGVLIVVWVRSTSEGVGPTPGAEYSVTGEGGDTVALPPTQPETVEPSTNVATTDERAYVASSETLSSSIDIHGRVVDELGRPIEMFALHAIHRDANNWFVALREWPLEFHKQGEFDFVGLASGRWELTPKAEGLKLRSERMIQATPEFRIDFVMMGVGVVAGFVLDLNGEPLADAVVALDGERGELHTNAAGAFEFEVQPGEHRLQASAAGFGSSAERKVEVGTRDRVTGIELPLRRGATLRGTVSDEKGQPVARAIIECAAAGSQFFKTDAEGRFEVMGIESGRVELLVAAPPTDASFEQIRYTTIELKVDEAKEVNLRFARARTVQVVVDISAFDHPDSIDVLAVPTGESMTTGIAFWAKPVQAGRLELTLPSVGRFAFQISGEVDYSSERIVDVPDQDVFELTLNY